MQILWLARGNRYKKKMQFPLSERVIYLQPKTLFIRRTELNAELFDGREIILWRSPVHRLSRNGPNKPLVLPLLHNSKRLLGADDWAGACSSGARINVDIPFHMHQRIYLNKLVRIFFFFILFRTQFIIDVVCMPSPVRFGCCCSFHRIRSMVM